MLTFFHDWRELVRGPFAPGPIVLCGILFTGAIVWNLAWVQICPVLECLGHIYEPWTIRKFKNGFFRTLYEYKRFQLAEKKTLIWWWAFWTGSWLMVFGWGSLMILLILYSD